MCVIKSVSLSDVWGVTIPPPIQPPTINMLSYNFTRFHLWVNLSVKKTVIFTKNFLKFSKKMIFLKI